MTALGVDISEYQGVNGAPVGKLIKAGAKFIIARAVIGTEVDRALDENAKAMRASAVPYGFYAFAYPGVPAADQARAFWNAVKAYVGPDTALIYDAEQGQAADKADEWAKELRQLIGSDRNLTLYTAAWYWLAHGNPDATGSFDALWVANYLQHPHQKFDDSIDTSGLDFKVHGLAGFRTATLYQFGSLNLDGAGYDGDLYAFDISTWRKVLGDGDPAPQRPPIDQRPRYRLGYNAYVDALSANAKPLDVPDPGNGPAWEVGVGDAKQDALGALAGLHMADPQP